MQVLVVCAGVVGFAMARAAVLKSHDVIVAEAIRFGAAWVRSGFLSSTRKLRAKLSLPRIHWRGMQSRAFVSPKLCKKYFQPAKSGPAC